jgi:signal transduction histidine kinase
MTSPAVGSGAVRERSDLQVLVLADTAAAAGLLSECVLTMLPTAQLTSLDPVLLAQRRVPDAACAVIDSTFAGQTGLEVLRALRAGGFTGGAVLVTDDEADSELATGAARLGGGRCLARAALAERPMMLAEAVVGAIRSDEGSPVLRELRRTQRLLAAGEVAMGLQHAMNNPLAALLAEAQLLELEDLPDEPHASVRRIIELARRVIALVRSLDVIGPTKRSS